MSGDSKQKGNLLLLVFEWVCSVHYTAYNVYLLDLPPVPGQSTMCTIVTTLQPEQGTIALEVNTRDKCIKDVRYH